MNKLITANEAVAFLKKSGCSPSVVKHCRAVSNLAVKLAQEIEKNGGKIDVQLVRIGGLLHDIGRSKTHNIDHAIVGAKIAAASSIPKPVIHIIERHIGLGLPANEAVKLGLPNRDYLPKTLEEKVVSYADQLTEGNHETSFDSTIQRYVEKFGESHPIITRFKRVHAELFSILGNLVVNNVNIT